MSILNNSNPFDREGDRPGNSDGYRSPGPEYFEALAINSLKAAKQIPQTKVKKINYTWRAIAAAIVLLITVSIWGNIITEPESQTADQVSTVEQQLAELSDEEIEAYIEMELPAFSNEILSYASEIDDQ